MKIHRNLALACAQTLGEIFENGAVATRAVERGIEIHPKWGARDRHFFAHSVFETVRWRRSLEFLAQSDEIWSLLAAFWTRQGWDLPDWGELENFSVAEFQNREIELQNAPRAIQQSIPDWLDALGESELGARWNDEIAALNQVAPVWIRANRLQTSPDELAAFFLMHNVESQRDERLPDALKITGSRPISPGWLQTGKMEIQDGASQLVAPFCDVQSGQKIVDCCAGAGGKSLHLAALMENQGEIWALDIAQQKLAQLKKRAGRAGAHIIQTRRVGRDFEADLIEKIGLADRVLIDAPCSGSGTLRRQPDLKWRLTPQFLGEIQQTQAQLLDFYSQLVKPDGKLIYATCSLFPSENERQIEAFLGRNSGFQLEASRAISPSETGWDGFFMARLQRFETVLPTLEREAV